MPSNLQHCPHCGTVGKVHRSRPRNRWEEIIRFMMPVYGVYRCHNCNWRGWLPRGSSSPKMRNLLIGLYAAIILGLLAFGTLAVIRNWPKPEFEYPTESPK